MKNNKLMKDFAQRCINVPLEIKVCAIKMFVQQCMDTYVIAFSEWRRHHRGANRKEVKSNMNFRKITMNLKLIKLTKKWKNYRESEIGKK